MKPRILRARARRLTAEIAAEAIASPEYGQARKKGGWGAGGRRAWRGDMVGDERLEITSPTIQALKTLRFSTLPMTKP